MPYVETFTIVNNSQYALQLDTTNSKNIGDNIWPSTVAARSTSLPFPQKGSLSNLNPTALYQLAGSASPVNITMHFFCDGVDPVVHVNMTMKFSSSSAELSGSSIYQTNSNPPITDSTDLDIEWTGDGSSQGSATFTVGAG
jgi:hypothetical protein